MSPSTPGLGPSRSAAAVNEEIRALWLEAGGVLNPEQRGLYGRLLEEWEQAVRAEVVKAA
jgi:hypothetical protein